MGWIIEVPHVCSKPGDIPASAKAALKLGGKPLWECDECHQQWSLIVSYGDQREPGEWYSWKKAK